MRDPTATGFTKEDYNAAWDRLHGFAESSRETRLVALSRFFVPGSEPAEWEMGVATGYLYYGFRDAKGQRLVDRFLAARGRGLPPGQVAAVVALQQAWASLFEVISVQVGIGLELRDLYSGETVRVRDVSASGQLKKWDLLFAWVMAFPDHQELTGAACLVPRPHLDRVRAAIDDAITRRLRHAEVYRRLMGLKVSDRQGASASRRSNPIFAATAHAT